MARLVWLLFSVLTIGASGLTYMNIGLEEQVLEKNKSVRSGSYGTSYLGGGYRGGK